MGENRAGSSRSMYDGPMGKAKGGRFEFWRWGGRKWRQLYLNNNKKKLSFFLYNCDH